MDITSNFSANLKKLRKSKNLTQEQLAKELDLTKQIISVYEKGKNLPTLYTVIKISNYFGCSIDSLVYEGTEVDISGLSKESTSSIKSVLTKFNKDNEKVINELNKNLHHLEILHSENNRIINLLNLDNVNTTCEFSNEISICNIPNTTTIKYFNAKNKVNNLKSYIQVPICGHVSAGNPKLAIENFERYLYIDSHFIPKDSNYFALKITGDSMNLLYNNNDLVLVKKISTLGNGDIGVILINNESATIKKYYLNNNIVSLQPLSTNKKHITQNYNTSTNNITILGKVIGGIKLSSEE